MATTTNHTIQSKIFNFPAEDQFDVGYTQKRFVICDLEGNVLDDAQGYGYKTITSAEKAAWYKFEGGKKKIDTVRLNAEKFWRSHKDFAVRMNVFLLDHAKEHLSAKDIIVFAIQQGVNDFNCDLIKFLPD